MSVGEGRLHINFEELPRVSRWIRLPLGLDTRQMMHLLPGRQCALWMVPRPSYCDRGNWLAHVHPYAARDAQIGLALDDADGWPRYYFDLERARGELEAWMVKRGQWCI